MITDEGIEITSKERNKLNSILKDKDGRPWPLIDEDAEYIDEWDMQENISEWIVNSDLKIREATEEECEQNGWDPDGTITFTNNKEQKRYSKLLDRIYKVLHEIGYRDGAELQINPWDGD